MDEGVESDIISKINIPSKDLYLEVIQEVLHSARMNCKNLDKNFKWTKILQILWEHLQTGLRKLDDQLLCSVCFYTALEFSQEKKYYLDKVYLLIKEELTLKDKLKVYKDQELLSKTNTFQVVSLMYGMMQSKFIVQVDYKEVPIMLDLLKSSLDLLILMAYEYSRYTFIVFKVISSFKVVSGTDLEKVLFGTDGRLCRELFNLVNDNWENPITGVRDLNRTIFQMILSMSSKDYTKIMMSNLETRMYWNKAKYLMMAVIIEQECNFAPSNHWIKVQDHWIDGVMCSLNKPGLVSAGADMYYAILKKLSSEDEWCQLFLNKIVEVLTSSCIKAAENFCNYWCVTTFKKLPGLSKILIDKLELIEGPKVILYSSLCILKQANKLGLVSKNWNSDNYSFVEQTVLEGIEHPHSQIRMLAFEVVAVNVGKAMPTSIEYELVMKYLQNNVNSDCTILRISMLGTIKCFLTHLCASYIEHTKQKLKCETDDLLHFYKNLQKFIVESLNLDGNYQRKITTIKLCHILLSSLNEVPKKRQKQTSTSGATMIKYLKDNESMILFDGDFLMKLFELLKDPSDDIRDTTVLLLLDQYSKTITAPLINHLIEDAKKCVRSKFFFQISCGQSMFRLITSLLLKEKYEDTAFKNVDDVFNFAYDVLNSEYEMKRDVVKSIEDGTQYHAYLSVLQEVLKVCKQFSCQINNLNEKIPQLLNILEAVSDQFAWEEEPAVSSDFSKMSDMVQSIIASSGYNPLDEKDFAKISGLQQIVLNCLWLNVKASCDFASCLITLGDGDAASCERCLAVITHVLETSRHKGAIEAAGAALGRGIQHLSWQRARGAGVAGGAGGRLPRALLARKLRSLLAGAAASVTRRGAGLSIMLHRIVSSDMGKGKPLFHYFMETLLRTCNSDQDAPIALDDGQKDLPKAIYIHFLTRIVTDSSLASDMMFYSADLAEIAFGNLTSPQWQIRNAALQLYGALVPKLIGQKKALGLDDENVGTVAIDEFRTHSPRLWQHMLKCLRELDDGNVVESHSNVLPILNVLANLAKRYNVEDSMFPDSEELLKSLFVLLGSPIFTVRRLTAKCVFNIFSSDVLSIMTAVKDENLLHGTLILTQHYYKHNKQEVILSLIKQISHIMTNRSCSYISRTEFEYFSNGAAYDIQEVLIEAKYNKYSPGVHRWADNRLQKYVQACPWQEIPYICTVFLDENDYEKYCEFILHKLTSEPNVTKQILINIGDILLNFKNKYQSCVIWKILYHISLQVELTSNIDLSIFDHIQKEVLYRTRYVIPFLASVADKIPTKYSIKLTEIILSLCDPDKSDVDMRYIAALANNQLAKVFHKMLDTVRISSIKCVVLLLQDEDEDVRTVNIHYYSNVIQKAVELQPFVCLTKILDTQFLESCLIDPKSGIPIICEDLLALLVSYAKSGDIDEYNPFSNDSKNIYFESEVLNKLIRNIKC